MVFKKPICRLTLLSLDIVEFEIGSKQTIDSILITANKRLLITESSFQFFAVYYVDTEEEVQWLNPVDRIINIMVPRSCDGQINLFHGVRFFPLSCWSITDTSAILQFFLDTRLQFLKGRLLMEFDKFCICSAIVIIQKTAGLTLGFTEVSHLFDEELSFSKGLLRQYEFSLSDIHEEVYEKFLVLKSQSPAQLISQFLDICQNSVNFGCFFYKITDTQGHNLLFGVNGRAINIFDAGNIYNPKKVFCFSKVDDILCSEDSLVVSIREHMNPVTNFGTQTLPSSSLKKYHFKCASNQMCKKIWGATVGQHKFYRSQIGETLHDNFDNTVRRLNEFLSSPVAVGTTSSLGFLKSLITSSMVPNLPEHRVLIQTPRICTSVHERTRKEKERDLQLYYRYKADIKLIEDELIDQLEGLKALCIEEANITGTIPKEIYMTLLPGEGMPNINKRVGTAFKLDDDMIDNALTLSTTEQLQADVQLHRKIVLAAERLANDKSANTSVRKKRRKDFKAAAIKLRGLERGLYQLRLSASKPDVSEYNNLLTMPKSNAGSGFSLNNLKYWPNFMNTRIGSTAKSCPTTPRGSIQDMSAEEADKLSVGKAFAFRRGPAERTAQKMSALNFPTEHRQSLGGLPPSLPQRKNTSSSLSSCKSDATSWSSQSCSNYIPESPTYSNIGYQTSVPYRSAYRNHNFPTFPEKHGHTSRSRSMSSNGNSASKTEFSVQKGCSVPSKKKDTDIEILAIGFSTSSLDRRVLRNRPNSPLNPKLRDSTSSEVSSTSSYNSSPLIMSRTTTFPVASDGSKFSSAKSLGMSVSTSKIQPSSKNMDHILSSISTRAAIHIRNSSVLLSPSKKTATMV